MERSQNRKENTSDEPKINSSSSLRVDIPTVTSDDSNRQSKEFSPDNDQNYWAKIFGGAAPLSHSNSGRKKSMRRADELSRSEKRKDSLTSNDVDAHTKWLLLQNIQNQGGFIEKSAHQN